MKDLFQIAGGTITGSEHVKSGKNNQDAFYWAVSENAIVAVVTDGCSDTPHSEVGAKIGAKIVADAVLMEAQSYNNIPTGLLPDPDRPDPFWHNVYVKVLSELSKISNATGIENQTIADYFLFTVVGALIRPETSSIFSIGDGVAFLNGAYGKIGPYPNNAPPYLGYALLWKTPGQIKPEWLRFTTHSLLDTASVNSILIGSDGSEDLIRAAGNNIPGKNEKVGPINQFWEDDRYFKNPDMIRRKLTLINRASARADWENRKIIKEYGLLPDDTTIIAIRRKKN